MGKMMSVNITEVKNRINVLPKSKIKVDMLSDGKKKISIDEGSGWVVIVDSVSNKIADDILGTTSNRVILG